MRMSLNLNRYPHTEGNNNLPSLTLLSDSRRPRFHSRSASWSHQNSSLLNQTPQDTTIASMFSPMRVIQDIVPGLASSASVNARPPLSPNIIRSSSTSSNITHTTRTFNEAGRHSGSVEVDLGDALLDNTSQENGRTDRMEFLSTLSWFRNAIPFILLLLVRLMWDHRLGILVFIGLFGTFFHVNNAVKKQVALKERRLNKIIIGTFFFLFANVFLIYFVFRNQRLEKCLMFQVPNVEKFDVWSVFWIVGVSDFVVRFVSMALKCVVIMAPRSLVHFRKRGKYFLLIENLSQFYRQLLPIRQWYLFFTDFHVGGEYFALVSTTLYLLLKIRMAFIQLKVLWTSLSCFAVDTRYGKSPSKEVLLEVGDGCPICQEAMDDPIELNVCKHIFCEDCIVMWFDRERTCPMCRAEVAEEPSWRDGCTQAFVQFF